MKKMVRPLMIGLFLFAGFGLLFYPTVSEWLAERSHMDAIQEYEGTLQTMLEEEIAAEREKAEQYNQSLTGSNIEDPFIPGSGSVIPDNYTSILDFGDGLMGYIEIPSINVELPIYHGTSEEVLKTGVGHMDMTAFPIGGEGNHTVLTGHTGLSSAKLFTDLDKVEEGDIFYINILEEVLAYQVQQILVIEPSDTDELLPAAGEDYVTLVTCTPYGINSHRLLVRGSRIPYTPDMEAEEAETVIDQYGYRLILAVAALMIVILIAAAVFINQRRHRRKGQ